MRLRNNQLKIVNTFLLSVALGISSLIACNPPSNVSLSSILQESVTFNWSCDDSAESWTIIYGPDGFIPALGGTIVSGISENQFTLSGLSPNTAYQVYIRSDCSQEGNHSDLVGPFSFTTLITCPAPANIALISYTDSSTTFTWTQPDQTELWEIEYGPLGFTLGTGTTITGITQNPFTITGLSYGTSYHVYIRAVCGELNSSWSQATGFTTNCIVLVPDLSESFDTAPIPSKCWSVRSGQITTNSSLGYTNHWGSDGFANAGTTGAARVHVQGTALFGWLISPSINLGDGSVSYILEFDVALTSLHLTTNPQLTGTDDKFAVVISTDNGSTWSSANILRVWDNLGSPWVYNGLSPQGCHVTIDLSGYNGIIKIGFYAESTVSNASNDLFIDNVAVNALPECMAPENVIAYDATETSVLVSWTDFTTTTAWDIIYGEFGFDPDVSGNIISGIVANPFTLEGLVDGITYDIYVRAHCSGNYNNWTGPAQISTLPYCLSPIGLSYSEVSASSVDFSWNESGTANEWDIVYGQAGFDPFTGGTLISGLASTDFTIEGLLPSTEYNIYVRSDCGEHKSNWSEKLKVITSCDNSTVLPVSESFESDLGYFINDFANNVDWDIISTVSTDGSSCVRNHFSDNNSNSMILRCPIDLSTTINPVLTFAHMPLTFSDTDHCYVEILTNGSTWTILPANRYMGSGNYHIPTQNNPEGPCFDMSSYYTSFSTPLTNAYWRNEKFSLSDYSGQAEVWLRFRVNSGSQLNFPGWYIDNIQIFDETCPKPADAEIIVIESSFAKLIWADNSFAEQWKVIYGLHGFNPVGEGSVMISNDTMTVITDLIPESYYDVYVLGICSGDEQSEITGPVSFHTTEQCVTPSELSVSNITKSQVTLAWAVPEPNSWIILYGETPLNIESGGILLSDISENPYTLTGLLPGTQYDVYVKADCDTDGESHWSGLYQFTMLPACLVPVGFTVSDVTASTALVSCANEPDATGWAILYGVSGFNPYTDGTIISGINTADYTISGLTPHTSYDIYCRSICGSCHSEWSGKIEINTTCYEPFNLPLIETFENGFGAFINSEGNGANWSIESAIAFEGQHCIKNAYTNSDNNLIVLRCPVDLSYAQHPYISFASMALTEKNYDYCYVEVSTNGTDWTFLSQESYMGEGLYQNAYLFMQYQSEGPCFMESSYPGWQNAAPDNNLWKVETFNLSDFAGEPEVWIRFRLHSDASYLRSGWLLDKIIIYNETCQQPSNLTLINSSGYSALIGWEEEGAATEWELVYGQQGFYPVETGIFVSTTSNQYNITGLSPETHYDVYVRSVCSDDNKSLWTGPFEFISNVPCTAIAGTSLIDADYQSISLEINPLGLETNWEILYGYSNFIAGEGNLVSVFDNTFMVSGLSDNTEYDFYIRSDCGANGYSDWVGPFTYATMVTCPPIVGIEVENITYDSFSFLIQAGSTETEWDITYCFQGEDPYTEGTLIEGNTNNPVTISDLEPETMYSVYIRANCGAFLGTAEPAGPYQITTLPLCPEVINITASDVQCNSAMISWNAGSEETGWTIEFGEQGFAQGTGTVETLSSPYILLDNLSINTIYTIYIKANCGGLLGDSDWQHFDFKTACDTISEFPWAEEFAEWEAISQCWDLTGGTNTVMHYNNSAVMANFWSWADGKTAYLTSQLIDKSLLVNPRIEFMWSHKFYSYMSPNDKLELQVSDDDGGTWTNVWVKSGSAFESNDGAGTTSPGSYTTSEPISLANFGDYIKFRFIFTSGYGSDAFIDNVMIYDVLCEPVVDIAIADISYDFAIVEWDNPTGNPVNMYYGLHGFDPASEGNIIHYISANTESYYIFGLLPNTMYDVYIESVCNDVHSELVGPISFTTQAYSTETDILGFSFGEYDADAADIDAVEKLVSLAVIEGTDVTSLAAIFNLSFGAKAYVNGVLQYSATTENDFSNPLLYLVVAQDEIHQTEWTIDVNILSDIIPETSHSISIYPNPATEYIYLYTTSQMYPDEITLMSSDSRVVSSTRNCTQNTLISLEGTNQAYICSE